MIKKFIKKLLGQAEPAAPPVPAPPRIPLGKRLEVGPEVHRIDPALLDERAVRVVRTLKDAGFEAYIVGGAVRDLLVGLRPKDFDVATDATPEQVKAQFRRAFIIGRRFRIVHVIHGRGRDHEVIEVSTFRAFLDPAASEAVEGNEKTSKQELAGRSHAVDASGRVLRDNVWGPQIEDAARRDFTVNAMYYDPVSEVLVDYHGGLADVQAKLLRMIGDPLARYREDPVRILRVVRFAAKLGFAIDDATRSPIREMSALLDNVPASRLFDEMIKLLQTGHALASVRELRQQGLQRVFPVLDVLMTGDDAKGEGSVRLVELALADTDRRVEEGRAVAPSFLLACLLWHEVRSRWAAARAAGAAPFPALQDAIDAVFNARIGDISGRGKLAADMREIWMMQPRFEQRRGGNAAHTLVEQPRFRAGYDFLRLRADAGEVPAELAEWWEDFSLGTPEEREALLVAAREQQRAPRRVPAAPAEETEPAAPADAAAPRKRRRRRRRKPEGAGNAAAATPSDDADPHA
jgi:poly(A) polymerase